MFFGLTNSLVTSQIINNILKDMINTRNVTSFINDMIVRTEEKEGHNEIIKKILKRIEENNLCIRLEKDKQKDREIRFLEVVIGQDKIKMEK